MNRSEALELLGYFSMLDLSIQERESILMDVFSENDEYESISNFGDPAYNLKIREYIKDKNKGVTNEYMATFLSKKIQKEVEVIGEQELLEPCPCCSYRTLEERGQYNICPVCFWEDDGSDSLERYSPANSMTLQDAKSNFLKWGVMDESFSDSKNKEALFMYPRLA